MEIMETYVVPPPAYFAEENTVAAKPLPPVTQYIIDHLLSSRRFTKSALANELQVSLVTINRWATGSIKRPTHKTFSRLLALYCATREETPLLAANA